MSDFEKPDFSKIDFKQLAEEFKNFGKTLVNAEEVIRKAQSGESLAGMQLCKAQTLKIRRFSKSGLRAQIWKAPNWPARHSMNQILSRPDFPTQTFRRFEW
jgi:hypothetical protein